MDNLNQVNGIERDIERYFSANDGRLGRHSFTLSQPTLIANKDVMKAFAEGLVAVSSQFEFPDGDMLPVLGVYFDDEMNALIVYEAGGKTGTIRLSLDELRSAVEKRLVKNSAIPECCEIATEAVMRQRNRRIGIHYASQLAYSRKKVNSLRKALTQFMTAQVAAARALRFNLDDYRLIVTQGCSECGKRKWHSPKITDAPAKFRELANKIEAYLAEVKRETGEA